MINLARGKLGASVFMVGNKWPVERNKLSIRRPLVLFFFVFVQTISFYYFFFVLFSCYIVFRFYFVILFFFNDI